MSLNSLFVLLHIFMEHRCTENNQHQDSSLNMKSAKYSGLGMFSETKLFYKQSPKRYGGTLSTQKIQTLQMINRLLQCSSAPVCFINQIQNGIQKPRHSILFKWVFIKPYVSENMCPIGNAENKNRSRYAEITLVVSHEIVYVWKGFWAADNKSKRCIW